MMKADITALFGSSLLLFAFFAGCDFVGGRTVDRERANSVYKDAMADYAAGRLDKAVDGLERVVRAAPDNSSARFQLACLLQDFKKDYIGAICNYREFLAQDRTGEKATFAKDRIVQCERLLCPELTKKYDQGGRAALMDENVVLKTKLAALEKTRADLEKRLERALVRAGESASETERMRQMLMGEVAEDAKRPVIKTEAEVLDDESDEKEDRIKISKDVKQLVLEEEKEKVETPFAVAEKKPAPVEEKKSVELKHEPRPPEYIVKEGDTLMKLAERFYGTQQLWRKIREANKTTVSTDGKIRVGQKLVLP